MADFGASNGAGPTIPSFEDTTILETSSHECQGGSHVCLHYCQDFRSPSSVIVSSTKTLMQDADAILDGTAQRQKASLSRIICDNKHVLLCFVQITLHVRIIGQALMSGKQQLHPLSARYNTLHDHAILISYIDLTLR